MDGGSMSAVQRLRQRFEVLDGVARASPAGPARSLSTADSVGSDGRKSPGAIPAPVQLRRLAGGGGPAAAAAATAATATGSGGTGKGGEAKSAPVRVSSSSGERERAVVVAKSPTVLKKTPSVVIKSALVSEAKPTVKTKSGTAVNATTNGRPSPGSVRTAAQLCNGVNHPTPLTARTVIAPTPAPTPALAPTPVPAPAFVPASVPASAPATAPASSIALAPAASIAPSPGADRQSSPIPASDAPPRPPKPGSDAGSGSGSGDGDGDGEPGDYLVPDGRPPVPPREPLSPEWGTVRSPLVRRSLPPPPPSGVSLQQQAWFHAVDRTGARALILRRGNGAFVVRPSQRGGAAAPFALTLLHAAQVYNFNVRQRSDGRFALGYRKKDEASFKSVEELVKHHQREPISLPTKARTCLTWYPSSGSSSP